MTHNELSTNPLPALDARSELRLVRSQVSTTDWALLGAVGLGSEYSEIAALSGGTAVAVRVRVMRLRRQVLSAVA
jgi:hypothetical protein